MGSYPTLCRHVLFYSESLIRASSSLDSTGFKGAIYAEPTRELYRTLGMTLETLARTPKGEERKSYLTLGPLMTALTSTWVCCWLCRLGSERRLTEGLRADH